VELIAQVRPDGFGANNNTVIGPRLAAARYFLLLNDDAFLDDGVLKTMTAYMDAHPEVGIAGARLNYPDGSPQSSYAAFPGVWDIVFYLWGFGKLLPKRFRVRFAGVIRPFARLLPRMARTYLDNWFQTPTSPMPVDWVSGACLMVRQKTIQQIGLLDSESFFMYYEDADWCRRARLAGWSVMFLPQVRVYHQQQASRSPITQKAWAESGIRYFRKYGSHFDVAVLRSNIALKAIVVLAGSVIQWPFRRKRDRLGQTMVLQRDLIRLGLSGAPGKKIQERTPDRAGKTALG
jgi:GT2 family glycosyltransferase